MLMTADSPVVAARRQRLQDWINARHQGIQADFVRATKINQGELSGLLGSKSFGEKKAATIEAQAGMPPGYLVNPFAPPAPGLSQSVSDQRKMISAVMRLTDYVRDVALEPIPPDKQEAVMEAAIVAVLEVGADRILSGSGLPDAARVVAAKIRAM